VDAISPAEFAELDAERDRQATRSLVQRGFEITPVAIAGSIRRIGLAYDVAEERTPESMRDWAISSWSRETVHGMCRPVRGTGRHMPCTIRVGLCA
jgi:hypothetical protein